MGNLGQPSLKEPTNRGKLGLTMQISWNGLGSFTISAKPAQTEVTLVTNPFMPGEAKFKAQTASIVVCSHEGKDTSNLGAVTAENIDNGRQVFVVDHPGEFEVLGMFVTGIDAPKKDGLAHTLYRFDAEGLRLGFLGALDRALSEGEVEALGPIDVLIVPSGGQDVLNPSDAAAVIAQIEPSLVIPAYVRTDNYAKAEALQKELGCQSQGSAKLKVSKALLPEDLQMILFT